MQTSPSLRAYQEAGVEELLKKLHTWKGALLADAPGLGKTAQAIEVANRLASEDGAPRPFTVLVVAPASLRINWSREIRTWAWTNAGYEVLTYGEVVRGKQSRPRYSLIIFDEAHYLKNPDAKRTKAGLALDADYRLFLTGTPVANRPMEMFPMLKSLGLKMNRTDYGVRYCGGKLITVPIRGGHGKRRAWDFTGSSNTDELNKVLRKSVMVRRTKEEVLKELPRKVRQVISMDFKSGESREFRERFASLSLAADILRTAGKIPFTELARERYNVAMAKLPYVLDFLNDLLEEEEKVVVFAHHRDVIDAIVKAGENRVALVGGMTERQKDAAVQAFQNGPARVFVGQIVAAGTGLTLTAARTVLFAELDWVPGNVTQAEDRCHRIGQKDTVRVFHLVAEGSIDARIVRAIVDKQQIIKEITK